MRVSLSHKKAYTCFHPAFSWRLWREKSVISWPRCFPRWFSMLARLQLFSVVLPPGVIAFARVRQRSPKAPSKPGLDVLNVWVNERLITRESTVLLDS